MHEGAGAKRGFADRATIEEDARIIADTHVDPCRQFHEQVVRMLPIHQRLAACALASGKQVGIAAIGH